MELIPIVREVIGGAEEPAVDARTLHGHLGVRRDFQTWFKERAEKYGFTEGTDFVKADSPHIGGASGGGNEQARGFPQIGGKPLGGRPTVDYVITLDTAKELSMVENNDVGRTARKYFIEAEKQARKPLTGKELLSAALLEADTTMKEQGARIAGLTAQVEAAQPAVDYVARFVRNDDVVLIKDFGTMHGVGQSQIFSLLCERGLIFRSQVCSHWSKSKNSMVEDFEYRPYQNKTTTKFFDLRPHHAAPRLNNGKVRQTLYIRQPHVEDLAKRLNLTALANEATS